MKYIKNKFFIICTSVALFLVIFTSVFSFMGMGNVLKDGVNTMLYPFRVIGVKLKESAENISLYFQNMEKLIEENKELKEENKELKENMIDAQAKDEENARLREYLEIKKTYNDYTLCEATVIAHEGEAYMTVMTLNRGSGDGIKKGMAVITSSGVVGSVYEVGYNWCKIRNIIEDSAGVGAYISRSGEIGIVEGDVMYKESNLCKLNYLPENTDAKEGDIVYTSGLGSVYPRGLPIGKIISVAKNDYDRTASAKIETFVDFCDLKYVMIITSFDIDSDPIKEEATTEAESLTEPSDEARG